MMLEITMLHINMHIYGSYDLEVDHLALNSQFGGLIMRKTISLTPSIP